MYVLSLLYVLQDTRDEVRSVYNELQRLTSENEELNMLLCGNNEKVCLMSTGE